MAEFELEGQSALLLKQAAEVSAALQGQCVRSLENVLEDMDIPDSKELRSLVDQDVFECSECGWWCEACEENNEEGGVCTDCCPEEDDNDDGDE